MATVRGPAFSVGMNMLLAADPGSPRWTSDREAVRAGTSSYDPIRAAPLPAEELTMRTSTSPSDGLRAQAR